MNQCLVMDDSTPCGIHYAGYPLLAANYASIGNFSYQLQTLVQPPLAVARSLEGPLDPAGLQAAASMRYQESLQCSQEVNDAIAQGCPVQADHKKGPLLCQPQCLIAIRTLKEYIDNNSKWEQDAQIAFQNSYINYCKTAGELQPLNDNVIIYL
jgi:hypothetical protein